MAIFDVLRYPISKYPTREELAALPEELFQKWMEENNWGGLPTIDSIAVYFEHRKGLGPEYYTRLNYNDVELLRKMIREYDEPIHDH